LPIGAFGLVDKRPEVIAALAAAEIMVHIGRGEALGMRPVTTMSGAAVD
jgi:xanthine dehydrogenase accessory factor